MRRRAIRSGVAVLLLGAGALLARPGTARAHGALRSSAPASGAHLAEAPRAVRLTFNERVELAVAQIELRAPNDSLVALSALRVGASPETIVADVIGPLSAGTYTVAWQIAGRDGHPVRGRFRFTIAPGAAGLATAVDTSAPRDTATHHDPIAMPTGGAFDAESPAYVAIRGMSFVAMLALIGAVAFARVARGAAGRGAPADWVADAARGARRVGLAASVALLATALLRLVAQDVAMHGAANAGDAESMRAMVVGTAWGKAWMLQGAAALTATLGFLLARRAPTLGGSLAAVAALGVAVAAALSGHAAAVPRVAPLAVAADAAHVLGAGGWLGTLLLVVLAGLPAALRLERGARGPAAAALVNAFSPVALACAGSVAVTGAAAAWMHLGVVEALWTTTYGRTLLLKLGVLALVGATGFYNWRRVRPALGDEVGARRVRRSSSLELAVGAAVLAVTAVLVATPTHAP